MSSATGIIELALWFILVLAALWGALLVLLFVVRPRAVGARDLLRLVPDIVRLLRSIVADRSAPLAARAVVIGIIVWIVSPIDLVPEFIPVIGPLDDVVVAVLALRYLRRRLGLEDLQRRWRGTAEGFEMLRRVIGS